MYRGVSICVRDFRLSKLTFYDLFRGMPLEDSSPDPLAQAQDTGEALYPSQVVQRIAYPLTFAGLQDT